MIDWSMVWVGVFPQMTLRCPFQCTLFSDSMIIAQYHVWFVTKKNLLTHLPCIWEPVTKGKEMQGDITHGTEGERYITKEEKRIHGRLGLHNVAPENSDEKCGLHETQRSNSKYFHVTYIAWYTRNNIFARWAWINRIQAHADELQETSKICDCIWRIWDIN